MGTNKGAADMAQMLDLPDRDSATAWQLLKHLARLVWWRLFKRDET